MILSDPVGLARWLGAGLCVAAVPASFLIACGAVWRIEHWPNVIFFLPVWALFSFGEWLWQFEGGWFALQRWLRLLLYTPTGGAVLLPPLTGWILRSWGG
jgi:hypothetical protein